MCVCYMPVLLAEKTLGVIGFSIAPTYWSILLGADSSFVLPTVGLDTKAGSDRITDS